MSKILRGFVGQGVAGFVKAAGQLLGTNTNDSAAAGFVGEHVSNSATGVSLTSPDAINITSISLTAGDWDVAMTAYFNFAAGSDSTIVQTSISKTTGTLTGTIGIPASGEIRIATTYPTATNADRSLNTPAIRISLASTTTIYAVAAATFTSTATVQGAIWARRVR